MDPHSILGVPEGVDESELTAAYRAQAKRWHPDRGGGEEAAPAEEGGEAAAEGGEAAPDAASGDSTE